MMVLRYLVYLFVILSGGIYGLYAFRSLSVPFRILTVLLWITLVSEICARILAYQKSSVPPYHFLVVADLILLPAIYARQFVTIVQRRVLFAVRIICPVLAILNSVFIQHLYEFPSNSILFLCLVAVTLSLFSFFIMLREPGALSVFQLPYFWMNAGNLLFYCFTFFVFGFHNAFIDREGLIPQWANIIIYFWNLVLYTFYLIALVKERQLNLKSLQSA